MDGVLRVLVWACVMSITLYVEVQASAENIFEQSEQLSSIKRVLEIHGQPKRTVPDARRNGQQGRLIPAGRLTIHSISSTGLVNDSVKVSVHYAGESDDTPTILWTIRRNNNSMAETQNGELHKEYRTWSVLINNFSATVNVHCEMYTNVQLMYFNLDPAEIQRRGNYLIDAVPVIDVNNTYVAAEDKDLVITAVVKSNPRQTEDIMDRSFHGFVCLNTSSDPPYVALDYGINWSLQQLTGELAELKMIIKRSYVKFGGLAWFAFQYQISDNIVQHFNEVYITEVLSYESNEVVPINNVGIGQCPSSKTLYSKYTSITCAALGNPKPEVSFLKMSADGSTETQMDTITTKSPNLLNQQELILDHLDPQVEGTYMCRATSGTMTVERMIEVQLSPWVNFDEVETGVTRNTTHEVVLSCKAYGQPRPTLEMRLYHEYGPDMAHSSLFEVSRTDPDARTAQLTLTISPSNPDIHTVYCVTDQGEDHPPEFKRIEVFPEIPGLWNWELYDRLRN